MTTERQASLARQVAEKKCKTCEGRRKVSFSPINDESSYKSCPDCHDDKGNPTGRAFPEWGKKCFGRNPCAPYRGEVCRTKIVKERDWATPEWAKGCRGGCRGDGYLLPTEAEQVKLGLEWLLAQGLHLQLNPADIFIPGQDILVYRDTLTEAVCQALLEVL